MNLLTVFQRAALNLNLTPGERAFLKVAKGVLVVGLVAALGVLAPLISGGNFHGLSPQVVQAMVGAAASAMYFAVEKLFTAKADTPIAPQHQQSSPTAAAAADGSAI